MNTCSYIHNTTAQTRSQGDFRKNKKNKEIAYIPRRRNNKKGTVSKLAFLNSPSETLFNDYSVAMIPAAFKALIAFSLSPTLNTISATPGSEEVNA